MLVTHAEADELFEALKSVLGLQRAKRFFLEGLADSKVSDELQDATEMIGEAHGPPIPGPPEPETPGSPLGLHTGVEGREA